MIFMPPVPTRAAVATTAPGMHVTEIILWQIIMIPITIKVIIIRTTMWTMMTTHIVPVSTVSKTRSTIWAIIVLSIILFGTTVTGLTLTGDIIPGTAE